MDHPMRNGPVIPLPNMRGPYSAGARSPRSTYSTPRLARSWLPIASTHASLPEPALNQSSIGCVRSNPASSRSAFARSTSRTQYPQAPSRCPSTRGGTTESAGCRVPLKICSAIVFRSIAMDSAPAHPRVGVPLLVEGQAEEGEAGGRRLLVPATEFLSGELTGLGRDPGDDVEVARQRVRVGGRGVGVDAVLDRLDRRGPRAAEVVEADQPDALARDEVAVGPERTVADRPASERIRVREERLG